MSVIGSNALAGASGAGGGAAASHTIERSLRFNSADTSYLNRTTTSAGNRRTWTWSGWLKRTKPGRQGIFFQASSPIVNSLYFNASDTLLWLVGGSSTHLQTNRVFRDTSAWMHVVLAVDSTQATQFDRIKLYINGVKLESADYTTSPITPLNYDYSVNAASSDHRLGGITYGYSDCYLADVYLIDGQQLEASDFGQYDSNNVWQPKDASGLTFGTNGFHLDFSDNTSTTTIGEDSSGNNNDFTANNISVTAGADNDSLIDTPTNYTASSGNNGGNYCILNPSDISGSSTISDGGLEASVAGGATNVISGNFHITSGQWYWEASITTTGTTCMIGVADGSQLPSARWWGSEGWYYYGANGNKYHAGGSAAYGSSYGQNDIIGIALDMDAGTVSFYKNGVSQGVAYNTGLSGLPIVPAVNNGGGVSTHTVVFNFGQRPFEYTPPSNHLALVTTNLSDPTIADGSTAMDVKTWQGSGVNDARTISGYNFSPDFVWGKTRTHAYRHMLYDTVRGAGKDLRSDSNAAEATNDQYGYLSAFTSDGFDTSPGTSDNDHWNHASKTYVAWAWDAGTSTVTNTDGTHSAQVRANSSTGFSISTHSRTTAASISTWGHGLSAAPEFAILKPYDGAYSWFVWHKSMGNRKRIYLNSTSAGNNYAFDVWSSDSTTLGIYGTIISGGGTALDCVTYAWTPIEGYSRFGSYEANGNADGPYVVTGFTPKLIMTKDIDSTSNWNVYDTSRDTHNVADRKLSWNLAGAESTLAAVDILSNGFKIRTSHADMNENTRTFIYCAWAEHPFKTARAR